MTRKTNAKEKQAKAEIKFDDPQWLGDVFGEYDRNIVAIENRLNVVISARGPNILIKGEDDHVLLAEDILKGIYNRLIDGQSIDKGAVEAIITMACDPRHTSQITEPQAAGKTGPTSEGQASEGQASTDSGIKSGGKTRKSSAADVPNIKIRTRKKTIFPRSVRQAHYMEGLARDDMIFALGPAGTGKTYLAVAQAVSQLASGSVERLILSRPAVEAGERLGFLPGDMKDKVDPFLRPLYDALYDTMPAEQVDRRIESGEIEIAPIAFMRGRTLSDAFVILDEAQNTTTAQMKMFLTRFGMNCRMVVCGDPKQVDLPGGAKSGLADAIHKIDAIDGVSTIRFGAADVVRHPLVGKIVEAYEGKDADH